MSTQSKPKSGAERAKAYRDRMRAQGLRPVQLWLPDTRTPEFRAEALRQSRAVAESPHAEEDQAFIDSISIWYSE